MDLSLLLLIKAKEKVWTSHPIISTPAGLEPFGSVRIEFYAR
jgi:hypothetical protein